MFKSRIGLAQVNKVHDEALSNYESTIKSVNAQFH